MDLSQEKDMRSAVEEANRHMMVFTILFFTYLLLVYSSQGLCLTLWISRSPSNCLMEVIKLVTINILCCPSKYWAEPQCSTLSQLFTEVVQVGKLALAGAQ